LGQFKELFPDTLQLVIHAKRSALKMLLKLRP